MSLPELPGRGLRGWAFDSPKPSCLLHARPLPGVLQNWGQCAQLSLWVLLGQGWPLLSILVKVTLPQGPALRSLGFYT